MKKLHILSDAAFGTGSGSTGSPASSSRTRAVIDELIDHRVAARLLGVSTRTLARWHLRSEGPPRISYGRSIKYRRVSIEVWLRGRETAARRGR